MKQLFTLLAILSFGFTLQAQGLELFGLQNDMPYDPLNPTVSSIQLVSVGSSNGVIAPIFTIPNSNSVAFGSKTYDHGRRRYMFWGFDDFGTAQYYSVSVDSGTYDSSPIQPNPFFNSPFPMQLEYDMQADTVYAIMKNQPLNLQYLVGVSLSDGSVDTIASLPGVGGVLNLASTFDSNNHRFMFQGSGSGPLRLYTVDGPSGTILSNPPIASSNGYFGLEYDHNTDRLLALLSVIDPTIPPSGINDYVRIYLVELDTLTGNSSQVGSAPVLEGFGASLLFGSNDFDQMSGTYIVAGSDDEYPGMTLFLIDAINGQVQTAVPYPNGVQFIQCDNQAFAKQAYGNISPVKPSFQLVSVPVSNPVQGLVTISLRTDAPSDLRFRILSMDGRILREALADRSEVRISMEGLASGLYLLSGMRGNERVYSQILIKE
jgi:hypothetical protein